MQIDVKLMGVLKEQTPPNESLVLAEGATIADALQRLDVPSDSVQVFTVNGRLVCSPQHPLSDGDQLTVLPPVAGG